tara:strand:+ start:1435 stop:2211 length:777 start_codon:yes stop_codon:yes gene_type:complete
MPETKLIQSVSTSLRILESMAGSGKALGITELARATSSTKPKIYRHLQTLMREGYVMQDPMNQKYLLTLKLFHLGQTISGSFDFLAEVRRILPSMIEKIRQTVTVGQIDDNGIRILDIFRYRSDIEITSPPGTLLGFNSSAQGKLALAFGPEWIWKKLQTQGLHQVTHNTIVDIDELRKEAKIVRQQGWADAPEQTLIGVNAIAAPVFSRTNDLAGIIAVVGSVQSLRPKLDKSLLNSLLSAAEQISSRLGYRPKLES